MKKIQCNWTLSLFLISFSLVHIKEGLAIKGRYSHGVDTACTGGTDCCARRKTPEAYAAVCYAAIGSLSVALHGVRFNFLAHFNLLTS